MDPYKTIIIASGAASGAKPATGLLGLRTTGRREPPSEADLGGAEAIEPQVTEVACSDR